MKKSSIKILFTASECAPFAKVGGLADVVSSLPKALKELGLEIKIVIPGYEIIDFKKYRFKLVSIFKFKNEKVKIYKGNLNKTNISVYLLENDKYLSKGEIYPGNGAHYNLFLIKRFLFFSQLILEFLSKIKFKPQIIHCHDWQTAILPVLTKLAAKDERKKIKTLLTIHNLPYQGEWSPGPIFKFLGLKGDELKTLKIRDESSDFNILEQGVLNADIVTTVSPTYTKEILTKIYGEELYKDLKKRKKDLYGILNGIDTELFNPETDQNLKANYLVNDFQKKVINKIDLQKTLKLPQDSKIPLFSFISRIVEQKGIDLITESIPDLVKLNCQIVILGQGEKKYENMLIRISKKFPKNISVNIRFDSVLARKIYAGADFILIPSRFEPCGLIQMIAQRYGTIPIARATGGIIDSVDNKVSGFLFQEFKKEVFLKKIKEALNFYFKKTRWGKMIKNAMEKDFSWQKSSREYLKLYQKLLNE
ncbi:MAG: hypothetical protein CO144_01825 [Candidatus Nealsonbacteria bacterium CG_4_9_14_3_um_filter_35_11]|uniref:Glycogen synthase n=2 Tax=Candidatus Nealsoniibacteriota TaxID=1817911 RepID=A0A2M7DB44_9BACT|nr:MAG: hypothetical protein COV62_01400 [Candidatus Nealsonbacteria bacterium CG11_big_fil_rev_8_21_14_0_20_35_11]PIV45654.1 MAG: hypothetical protein COS24_01075 [Candidatus Nealsonbacteria bacterium CG02_land_8_20_14_3_00_34_20]PIZ90052.1 MAG: hypothetical protein COX88_00505 [Candidatus Nealsonbacteria bacterium CG_4_10_14_0_2_um_filter_35_20]PJA84418.1 MAG: hypothetical protein CO144_01825 [Candidatus Nealsonbacteria bacterium CG_4_9_14_3_um_filter_35_11]